MKKQLQQERPAKDQRRLHFPTASAVEPRCQSASDQIDS